MTAAQITPATALPLIHNSLRNLARDLRGVVNADWAAALEDLVIDLGDVVDQLGEEATP